MSYISKPRDFPMRKSTMQSYAYCQRYFYYQFIAKIPQDKSVKMTAAQQGTDFHAGSAEFYGKVKIWQDPTYEHYRECLPIGTLIDRWYDLFAQFEVDRMTKILAMGLEPKRYFMPLYNEFHLELPDEDMFGTIDRIWLSYDDYPIIQDVKPKNRKSRTGLRRELAFYLYMCNQHPDLEELKPFNHISGYFYKDAEAWVEKVAKRSMNSMFDWLDKIDYSICTRNHVDDWPRNTWALCLGCPFRHPCYLEDKFEVPEIPTLKKIRVAREQGNEVGKGGWVKKG